MKVLFYLLGIFALVSGVCLKANGIFNIRDGPCGQIRGQLANGETTNYRLGATPTTCTLSGTSYTFIPIAKLSGWVASDAVDVCSGSCVKATSAVNVRNGACGTIVSSLNDGTQTTTNGNMKVGVCGGKNYLWVGITQGFVAADFLGDCTTTPPPPAPENSCKSDQKPTVVGAKGLALIKSFEGKMNCWYIDPVGVPTICYGYANPPYTKGTCLSDAQCDNLLVTQLRSYAKCVADNTKVPLNQNQFDALTSFTYNLGCGAFTSSSMRASLNAGRYQDVCAGMKLWVRGGGAVLPGLVRRRNAECDLFNSCNGIPQLGKYVSCPAADPCQACILNSDEGILNYYQGEGYDITCSAANWQKMYDHYCTTRDPWDCYWKSAAGNLPNVTAVCGNECGVLPTPQIPGDGNPFDAACLGSVDLCPGNDCEAQLGTNSTCETTTGKCIPTDGTKTPVNLPKCPQPADASSALSLKVTLLLAVVLFFLSF